MTQADRLASARAQLKAVRDLREKWDSYDADPPSPVALDRARALVNDSRVPPATVRAHRPTRASPESGAVLAWPGGVEVTIASGGAMSIEVNRATSSISVAVSLVDAATREEPRPTAGVRKEA